MRITCIVVGLALVATPAAARSMKDVPAEVQVHSEKVKSLMTGLASGIADCSSAEITATMKELADLEDDMATINGIALSSRSGAGERYIARNVMKEIFPLLSEAHLGLADSLLKARCLMQADALYRDVLTRYTGSNYDSLRERAKIGIDDIRFAQSKEQQ